MQYIAFPSELCVSGVLPGFGKEGQHSTPALYNAIISRWLSSVARFAVEDRSSIAGCSWYFRPPFFHVSLPPLPRFLSSNRIVRVNTPAYNSWNFFFFSCLILLVTFLTQFYHAFLLFIFLSRQFLPVFPPELDLSFPFLIPYANKNVCLALGIFRASLLNFYFTVTFLTLFFFLSFFFINCWI